MGCISFVHEILAVQKYVIYDWMITFHSTLKYMYYECKIIGDVLVNIRLESRN
jgi:hypothetical protein